MNAKKVTSSKVRRNLTVLCMVSTALAIRLAVIPFTIGEWMNPSYIGQYEPGNLAIALIQGRGLGSPWITGANQASAVMSPVAHSLTRPQVEAVAAYLSYLK